MPPKRKRNASSPQKGLLPGEKLRRNAIPGASSSSPWGWVGSEVVEPEQITSEHRLAACNLSRRNNNAFCSNKYSHQEEETSTKPTPSLSVSNGELGDDIIVISDNEAPSCSKKDCKTNPNCLNYLGQESWGDEDAAEEKLIKYGKLGRDPSQYTREADLPVGLKNLGATCYANASLQVWYRDLAFRAGVFSCEPPDGIQEEKYKESPIFQLQVTFAALQEGNKTSFNPQKLVESLQLRTSEQQDAQEFSKLFMSHLDAEFKKQSSPVKSLITDQFQGSQVYGTICHACKNRSERASDFLEVEISFDSNSTLEDRIAASLLPETLSGDNKYFCSRCEALQDATRYTELRQLPPVLHFSLLRFVYDVSTMERKKSKKSIAFPLTLDMHKFIGSKNIREYTAPADKEDSLYELRGILLHKGASAYHGHYEAQVYDIEYKSWFQFNDETVTPIASLGDKVPSIKPEDTDEKPDSSQVRKNRVNARKRRRIDDSDDDVIEVKPKASPLAVPKSADKPGLITSKDAYMLIYARKSNSEGKLDSEASVASGSNTSLAPKPPARAMSIIKALNSEHDTACKDFKEKENQIKSKFQDLRRKVRDIYQNWTIRNDSDESVVVSRQALESWLSEYCVEAVLKEDERTSALERLSRERSPSPNPTADASLPIPIPVSDITCEHGLLDPQKSKDMKRISQRMFDEIVKTTNCTFDPVLQPSDACSTCVLTLFKEKLYELEHPKYVKQFEEISSVLEDEMGYWISKKWCKDWKLIKPKMHVVSKEDPAPDLAEFYSHVLCEHGGLSLNTTNRRKISVEAMQLLHELFPSWKPPSSNTETCAVCDAEVHISKEDKKEVRRRAEEEKSRLKFIQQSSLNVWTNGFATLSCAVIPSHFIKSWRRWVNNPSDNPRPEEVDNKTFLCSHDHLIFDPNCNTDLDSTIIIIERDQWDELQSIYPGGPLIELTKHSEGKVEYEHPIPVCHECRLKRKTEWETADIFLRVRGPEGSEPSKVDSESKPKPIVKYTRINGARQSKRLRQIKEHGERRRISVSKSTTVKDLKVMANEEFSIPTICQRLFYQGRELEDNAETVASLQISVNDIIDVREETEILEIVSDSDEPPTKRRREGPAFGGTLLGSTESPWSSSPERTPGPTFTNLADEKPCLVCTFSNDSNALSCEMCNTLFS